MAVWAGGISQRAVHGNSAGVLGVSALGCELAGAGWLCLCSAFSGSGLFT